MEHLALCHGYEKSGNISSVFDEALCIWTVLYHPHPVLAKFAQ